MCRAVRWVKKWEERLPRLRPGGNGGLRKFLNFLDKFRRASMPGLRTVLEAAFPALHDVKLLRDAKDAAAEQTEPELSEGQALLSEQVSRPEDKLLRSQPLGK